MKKKLLGLMAAIAVIVGMYTVPVFAAGEVKYLDEYGTKKLLYEYKELTADYWASTENTDDKNKLTSGWYVVNGNVTFSERIKVEGGVHLILADGAHLKAEKGISVPGSEIQNNNKVPLNNSLTIYSQSFGADMGALTANTSFSFAAIGGDLGIDAGTITINGGRINATGSAGIGGGYEGSGGTITINNGDVTATAANGNKAAGLGHGASSDGSGKITITGGTVTAYGDEWGQGIGGHYIMITGGFVNAYISGKEPTASAIGDGNIRNAVTEDIVQGSGSITITGENTVVVTHGKINKDNTTTTFSGGLILEIMKENGSITGGVGTVNGKVILTRDVEIPSGVTLTIEENAALTIPSGVTFTNNATITGGGKIINHGKIEGNGTIASNLPIVTQPKIEAQPVNKQVTAGESAAFSVTVSGGSTTKFQWQVSTDNGVNWNNIDGATADEYVISVTSYSMNGYRYRCIATNEAGEATGGSATLTVDQILLSAPADVKWDTDVVNKATWSAVNNASGYSLQLYKNNAKFGDAVSVSNATEYTFTITEDGKYTFEVKAIGEGDYKSSTEVSSNEVIFIAAGISKHPEAQVVTAGDDATFMVEVKGNPNPERQWQVSTDGGATWTDIEGEKASTYKTKSAYSMNGWQYRYKVKNFMKEAFSNPVTLTVNQILLSDPTNVKWDTDVVNKATWSAVNNASGYSAQLYKDGVKAGDAVSVSDATEYTFIITEDAEYTFEVEAIGTGDYASSGKVVSNSVSFVVADVVTQPADREITAGEAASFAVVVKGNPEPMLQWQVSKDSGTTWTDVEGAKATIYTVDTTDYGMNGWKYRCVVTSMLGQVSSDPVVLTVNQIPLSVPTNLKWDTSVIGKASWSAVNNASGYSVQLYKDGMKAGDAVNVLSATEYIFNITEEGNYTFSVTALGAGNYSTGSSGDSGTGTAEEGKVKLYTIAFDSQGGSACDVQITAEGNKGTAPTVPKKNGYDFEGWYTSSDFAVGTEWSFDDNTVTESIILYAKWKKIQEDFKDDPDKNHPEPTPTAPEPTPAAPEPTPTAPEPTPAAPEPTPAAPEPTPAAPEPTPAAPESAPVAPEPTPTAPEPTPAAPEPAPVAPEPVPSGSEVNEAPRTGDNIIIGLWMVVLILSGVSFLTILLQKRKYK